MANTEVKLSASGEKVVSVNATAASAIATIAAAVDIKSYVTAAILSDGSTAAVTSARATLIYTKDGVAQTIGIQLPNAAVAPVMLNFGSHPIEGDTNTAITLTIPTRGTGNVAEATLIYYQRPS